ncbi:hypothetical protein EVAR_80546_1 [Eumeta japonica]|uniref:Uncharacterized protein n=1 Tax=Eumeta variegata TaxID=151549 RepID=A0A4C1TNN8_EUMVA|nr:hypothetical protein EVAR_80546_1 [Eumeta japonica]
MSKLHLRQYKNTVVFPLFIKDFTKFCICTAILVDLHYRNAAVRSDLFCDSEICGWRTKTNVLEFLKNPRTRSERLASLAASGGGKRSGA